MLITYLKEERWIEDMGMDPWQNSLHNEYVWSVWRVIKETKREM